MTTALNTIETPAAAVPSIDLQTLCRTHEQNELSFILVCVKEQCQNSSSESIEENYRNFVFSTLNSCNSSVIWSCFDLQLNNRKTNTGTTNFKEYFEIWPPSNFLTRVENVINDDSESELCYTWKEGQFSLETAGRIALMDYFLDDYANYHFGATEYDLIGKQLAYEYAYHIQDTITPEQKKAIDDFYYDYDTTLDTIEDFISELLNPSKENDSDSEAV